MPKLWDISPPVSSRSPVFPGDTPYRQRWTWTLSPDCPVNVSEITLSPHIGAHADAPLHYQSGAQAAGALPLEPFLGRCRVIHAIGCGPLVLPAHLAHAADALPGRVLVRTARRAALDAWHDDFAAFAPQTIEWLADRGVVLVGIDTPSIDPAESKTLDSHQAVLRRGLRVLENLLLDAVEPGDYELIALPLAWVEADASPVRAVLRELPARTGHGEEP
jgi:arylformamidase